MARTKFDGAAARTLEAVYLAPDMVAQRARVLDLLAPRPGERVLDIGVGPGLLALDLARLVGPSGAVTGVDVSPDMLAMSAARLQGQPQARLLHADAADFAALPDAGFDAAVSTQVHEYVPDIPRALAELHRVLRPGGRALILDTDWRSIVWHSGDAARMERVLACWDGHLADPHLPARLGPLLRAAGFQLLRTEIAPLYSPAWQPVSYAAGIMGQVESYVRANGLAAAEVDAWRDDQQALIARGEFFFSLNRYIFLAVR